jgi:uncharacterized protein YjbJ (UPF0337 family)
MDRNRIEGKMKQVKGAAKDALGGLTGNGRQQVSGKLDKAAGRVQETYGKVKDEVRASARKGEENSKRDFD